MTINCIEERVKILEHLWNKHHDTKHCGILLQQLKNDIVFFCSEKLTEDLERKINELYEEINDHE